MTTTTRRKSVEFRLETLEPRIALSAVGHPAGGPTHAAVRPHTPPNPVLVNLTPQKTGVVITDATIDPRVGVVTVRGTVTVNPVVPPPYYYPNPYPLYPYSIYTSAAVSQAVNRLSSVTGTGSTNLQVKDATVTRLPFTLEIAAASGTFATGKAMITLSAPGPYVYDGSPLIVIVRLRNVRLY